MEIIVRACGERTENECVRLAEKHGRVHVIHARPFGESIRQTYKLAQKIDQEFIPVVDADVLLFDNTLQSAIHEMRSKNKNIFCLDGTTNDKIMMMKRRAGIHIYRTSLLARAEKFIDDNHIKPETNTRKQMIKLGFPTIKSKIIFGLHDHEQYYADLWRKAVAQTRKLAGMMGNKPEQWKKLMKNDIDFFVVHHAHEYGLTLDEKIIIDIDKKYDAINQLEKLGIKEKGEL